MDILHSVYLIDFHKVCRTCLSTGPLHPIFAGIGEDHKETYSLKIFNSTGIKVSSDDGLPQNMCTGCIEDLNNNIKFREKCRLTENKLLKFKHNTDDEQKTNDSIVKNVQLGKRQQNIVKKTLARKKSVIVDAKTLVEHDHLKSVNCTDSFDTPEKVSVNTEKDFKLESCDDDSTASDALHNNLDKDNYLLCVEDSSLRDCLHSPAYSSQVDKPELHSGNPSDDTNIQTNDLISSIGISNPHIDNIKPSTRRINSNLQHIVNLISSEDGKSKRAVCKLCSKNLSLRSINSHISTNHPQVDTRRERCEFCEKVIMKNKMEKHFTLIHILDGEKAKFLCGYCKSAYEKKEELKEHITTCRERKKSRKASDRGREMKACDVCGKLMQSASLRHHKAVAHSGLGPVCEHCGKMFANKIRLDEHCRAKHGYEKYKCGQCSFTSSGSMAMRNHERRHRGEKPFVCEECGAKFHAAYLLAQHKQTHRKEKLAKCDLCSASFKANNSLHMHKLTCHSKSTYRCYLCERVFSCRHYVVKHLRQFHSYKGEVGRVEKVEEKLMSERYPLENKNED